MHGALRDDRGTVCALRNPRAFGGQPGSPLLSMQPGSASQPNLMPPDMSNRDAESIVNPRPGCIGKPRFCGARPEPRYRRQARLRRCRSRDRICLLIAVQAGERLATHSAVSPGAADGCFARMMGKPTGARLTADGALLLSWGVVLLVRHERTRWGVTGAVQIVDVGVAWLSGPIALPWIHHQCSFRETRPAGSGSPFERRRRGFRCAVRRGTASRLLAGERRASEPVAPQQVFDLQDERDSHTQEETDSHEQHRWTRIRKPPLIECVYHAVVTNRSRSRRSLAGWTSRSID